MHHYRTRDYRVARSMNEAFGPYSELTPKRESHAKAWAVIVGYGVAIGFIWYLTVALVA